VVVEVQETPPSMLVTDTLVVVEVVVRHHSILTKTALISRFKEVVLHTPWRVSKPSSALDLEVVVDLTGTTPVILTHQVKVDRVLLDVLLSVGERLNFKQYIF
jgi:hypothetical protein